MSSELDNYLNSLNNIGNNELKVKLENFYLFNQSVISFFKGIDNQFKSLLSATKIDEAFANNIIENFNTVLDTLTKVKREIVFFDESTIHNSLKSKYSKAIVYIQDSMNLNEIDDVISNFNSLMSDNEYVFFAEKQDFENAEKAKIEKKIKQKEDEEREVRKLTKQNEINNIKSELIKEEYEIRKKVIDFFLIQNFKIIVQYGNDFNSLNAQNYTDVEYNYYCEGDYTNLRIKLEQKLHKQNDIPKNMTDYFEKYFFPESAIEIIDVSITNPLFYFDTTVDYGSNINMDFGFNHLKTAHIANNIVMLRLNQTSRLGFENEDNYNKKLFKHHYKWITKSKTYENILYRKGNIPLFLEFDYQRKDFAGAISIWVQHLRKMQKFNGENDLLLTKHYEPHLF